MRKAITAAVSAVALSGCAASSVGDLRANPAKRYEFTSPDGYQQVYRNIARMARECWAGGFIGSQFVVDADLFPDLAVGEVTIRVAGLTNMVHANALVTPSDAKEGARVVVWNSLSTWNDMGPRIQRWASGGQSCS